MICERFANTLNSHILGNLIDIKNYPLILCITGKPGMGKTYQLREHLSKIGFHIFSVSSADLESDKAGAPAKLLREQYVKASYELSNKKLATVIIDDIDTTLGEWEQNTGTVNHQDILAFFMHIADNPSYIENIGKTERVPLFFTGNDFTKLYEPLRRPVRMLNFEWLPTIQEKISIVSSLFNTESTNAIEQLIKRYPDEPISFFAQLQTQKIVSQLSSMASMAMFNQILTNDAYRRTLQRDFNDKRLKFDWLTEI